MAKNKPKGSGKRKTGDGAIAADLESGLNDLRRGTPQATDHLSNATALSVIAQYGTEEERRTAIEILKRWFEEFQD